MSSVPIVPDKLVLKEVDAALPGIYTRTRFESTEGVSTTISNIQIPPLRNSYLNCKDGFLTFTVQVTLDGTNLPTALNSEVGNILLDGCGGISFVRSITLLQNNTTIQHIDNIAKIHAMVQIAEANRDTSGIRSILTGSSYAVPGPNLRGNQLTQFGSVVAGATATKCTFAPMTFCIPLLGILSTANIPICMLNEGMTIRINWSTDVNNSLYTYGNTDASQQSTITSVGVQEFTNVSYDCGTARLDDAAQLAVEKENGYKSKPIEWSGVSYYAGTRNTTAVELSTSTTAEHIIGGFTFTSLKSILYASFCKPDGLLSNAPNTPHIVHSSLRYRVNGIERPRNHINTLAKMVQHTASCVGSVSQSTATGLMNADMTNMNFRPIETNLAANNLFSDRGIIGVSLNSFPQIDSVSGIDTRGGDVSVELESTGSDTNKSMNTYFVGIFDVTYVIEDGVMRASF